MGRYRKTHLVLTEGFYHFPGTEFPVFDTALGKVGLYVCYDMCFPEVTRILANKGAELLISVTGWPNVTGTDDASGHTEYMLFQKRAPRRIWCPSLSPRCAGSTSRDTA